uniref:Uncharacterized protein n=1 Tax=Salix viminalis TaxID=40686 RepID=A0A6N2K2Y5_SALVM
MDMIVGVESEWWHDSSRLRQSVFICLVVATSILMVAVAEPIFKQKGLSYNETQKGIDSYTTSYLMLYGFSSLSSPTSSLQQLQSLLLSLSLAGEKQKTQRWKGEEEKNGETERVET